MKLIHLGGVPSRSISVSDAGYEQIVTLIMASRCCCKCGDTFSQINPVVGVNVCLGCFVTQHTHLTSVGSLGEPDEEGYVTYKFLDEEGYVFLSTADRSDSPTRSIAQTLAHWGFAAPEQYIHPKYGEYRLWPNNWRISGNIQTASVLVAENGSGSKYTATFLLYKGGTYKELTKKQLEMKLLVQRAREAIEATKDSEGWYHLGSYPTKWVSDAFVYTVVSEMESAVYDVQMKIRASGKSAAQPTEAEKEVTA